jgi:pimeloyl-ACP methyl ester carboxylesterase
MAKKNSIETKPQSRFAQFENNRVHYLDVGKGNSALIFVHGWTCNAEFWKGSYTAFKNIRVIAVDLPGHGESDKPQANYTMDYFARSVEAVMKDAKITKAVLVGHSMGTPVIRQFYRLYPEKTLGLVIVDGGLRPFAPKEQIEKFFAPLKANYKQAMPQFIDGMLAPIKDEKLKTEIKTSMLNTPEQVALSAMDGMSDATIWTNDKINVPVLAVMAKSPFWTNDYEQYVRSIVPNIDYQIWDGVSHFLMMEKPDEFNKTIAAFLVKSNLAK